VKSNGKKQLLLVRPIVVFSSLVFSLLKQFSISTMPRGKKAQVWSADFALSLLIFTVASLITYSIIVNSLQDDAYSDVRAQAVVAAEILNTEGYPQYWTNDTVIRAGIRSDDRLSLRKFRELSYIDNATLRRVLRTTDNVYVYLSNASNATVSFFGNCGVGDFSVSSSLANKTLPAVSLAGGQHPVSDNMNLSIRADNAVIGNLSAYDVVVIEGNISRNLSLSELTFHLESLAKRGVSFIIIGDPGASMLGVSINKTIASNITLEDGADIGFNANETLNITAGSTDTINQSLHPAVYNFTVIARASGGAVAYATWRYYDAQVFYLATAMGVRADGTNLTLHLANLTNGLIVESGPICTTPVPAGDAKQVAKATRTIAYHDQLLTVNVLVWRAR